MSIPKKVADRITSAMKRLVQIILQQKARDVSEADTVTLAKDILSEVFGYDKYTEVTGEYAIRGTYCDLAIKIDDKLCVLIEVKAVGITLGDRHVKQAVDYAANQGVEWVILTNAAIWQLYNVTFAKPIDKKLVVEIDVTTSDCKRESDLDTLYLFSKEGFKKGMHVELRDKRDATSRFMIAALLLHNEDVIRALRRELKQIVNIHVTDEDIVNVLQSEVIKRDAVEGPLAEEASARVRRAQKRSAKSDSKKPDESSQVVPIDACEPAEPRVICEEDSSESADQA